MKDLDGGWEEWAAIAVILAIGFFTCFGIYSLIRLVLQW